MQRLLIAFIQHCYEGEADIHTARHAILVVQFLGRHLKGKLRGAWDSIESWSAEVESFLRPPLPVRALQALVGMARVLGYAYAKQGDRTPALELFTLASLLEVGFYGLLRPGEMLSLCPRLVALPGSAAVASSFAIISIQITKNPRAMGRQQFAVVRHPTAAAWLKWLFEDQPEDKLIWSWSPARFRGRFKWLSSLLGLTDCHSVPASCRAGGATYFYQLGVEPTRLAFWGRWAAEKSVTHYVQEAMASLVLRQLSPQVSSRMVRLADIISYTMSPPSVTRKLLCL